MRNPEIPVRQFVFSKFQHFFIVPFLGLLFDQINVLNNPQRSALVNIQKEGFAHYLKYFFLELYVFELISFFILAILIKYYSRLLKLNTVKAGLKALVLHELKWLPLFVLSIFIFGPITNFFRYIFLIYPQHGWKLYFPEFFMTVSMYFNYFIPIIVWGYLIVNTNLLLSYLNRSREERSSAGITEFNAFVLPVNDINEQNPTVTETYLEVIEGHTLKGTTLLSISDILWFEVQNKTYYANCIAEIYTVKKTIAELEKELNSNQFFRINRSQLININAILTYSYWEFEKYIIRLKNIEDKEFVITRKRFKELKNQLERSKLKTYNQQEVIPINRTSLIN